MCPGHIPLQFSLALPPVSLWRGPKLQDSVVSTTDKKWTQFIISAENGFVLWIKHCKDDISEEVHLCWKEERRNSCQYPVTNCGTLCLVAYYMLLHKLLLQNTCFSFKLNCKTAMSFNMTGRPCELCCWWSHHCALLKLCHHPIKQVLCSCTL